MPITTYTIVAIIKFLLVNTDCPVSRALGIQNLSIFRLFSPLLFLYLRIFYGTTNCLIASLVG